MQMRPPHTSSLRGTLTNERRALGVLTNQRPVLPEKVTPEAGVTSRRGDPQQIEAVVSAQLPPAALLEAEILAIAASEVKQQLITRQ